MIVIIVDPDSPELKKLATTLQRQIIDQSPEEQVNIVPSDQLTTSSEAHYLPLTYNYPKTLSFEAQGVFQACEQVTTLRDWVTTQLEYKTGEGNYWLPIVYTAKGPLYAEAIEYQNDHYQQPFHLKDDQRQPLYHLAYDLLEKINATPAVYTLQFGIQGQEIIFDRLFPFPHPSTLASVGVQSPDLLTCHWRCLIRQPIVELLIQPTS